MVKAFIFCAGSGERWNQYLGVPKQLISFNGETILDRTIKLLNKHGVNEICIVSRNQLICDYFHQTLLIPSTDSLAESMFLTRDYWIDKNVFLLGDVFYSEQSISRILKSNRDFVVFGRPWQSVIVNCGHGEMFGLYFSDNKRNFLLGIIERGLSIKEISGQPNLWNLYQIASEIPLGSKHYMPKILVPIDDFTNDIDTPTDYFRRRKLYENISSWGENSLIIKVSIMLLIPQHYLGILRWWLSNLSFRKVKIFSTSINWILNFFSLYS